MTTQPPRSYTRLAIAILAAAVILSATIIVSSQAERTITTTLTATSATGTGASSGTMSATITNSTLNTICSIAAPPGTLLLKIVNDSTGQPMPSVPVRAENLFPSCPPNPHTISSLGTMETNGSGVILLSGLGEDYLTVIYGPRTYSVNASIETGVWTCVTLGLISGDLNITYSAPSFESRCAGSSSTSSSTTNVQSVTGTSVDSASDTYLTSCFPSSIGGFQFLIISDSTGAPVGGETVNAVDTLGCDIVGQPPETQTVYLDNFTVGQGGWLTPVFPNQALAGGKLTFTVIYQGETYAFSATVPPLGTSCVTLRVPSGNVTTASVVNGEGSYCWQ